MNKLDELMALAEEYGSCMCAVDASTPMSEERDWAEYKTAKAALQDALKAVVEDTERLNWLDSVRLSVYAIVHMEDAAAFHPFNGSMTKHVFDGWSVGMSEKQELSVRAAIDVARKP